MRRIGKTSLVIVGVALLAFAAVMIFLRFSVPGEKEILARIAVLEKSPPTSCPHPLAEDGLLPALFNLAGTYMISGHHSKATPYFLRAIELQKKLCGENYPGNLGPLMLLAENYELEGRHKEAKAIRQEIQHLREKTQARIENRT